MKEYTAPDISIVDLTTDVITTSDVGDTPFSNLGW